LDSALSASLLSDVPDSLSPAEPSPEALSDSPSDHVLYVFPFVSTDSPTALLASDIDSSVVSFDDTSCMISGALVITENGAADVVGCH